MLYFVVQSLKCGRITITEYPRHSSPCATVNCFDNPQFLFFEPMKCHISSNSIWVISPDTFGSCRFSTYSRIQRYTNVWSIFKIRPNIRYDPFAIAYSNIQSAFFAATALLVRSSPSLKFKPHVLHLYLCFLATIPFFVILSDLHSLQSIV